MAMQGFGMRLASWWRPLLSAPDMRMRQRYADGTVVGTFLDVSTGVYDTSIGEETLQVKADINCLNFIELEDGPMIVGAPHAAYREGVLANLATAHAMAKVVFAVELDADSCDLAGVFTPQAAEPLTSQDT